MPRRVNSFVATVPAVLFVVAIAAFAGSPARAESACLEQPSQPATEGTRWYLRYDRAKGRRCWILADASTNTRDAATPQGQPSAGATPTLSSRLAELFDSLTGSSTNATTPANLTYAPRKTQGNSVSATRTESGVRTEQRDPVEGHVGKRAVPTLTEPQRNALFEDFLRWHESQRTIGQLNSSLPSR